MDQYQTPDSTYNSEDAEDASPSPPPQGTKAVERRMPSNNRFLVGSGVTASSSVGAAPKLLLKATGSGSFQSTPVESTPADGSVPPIPKLIFTGNFGKGQAKSATEAGGIHSLTSIAQRLSREGGEGSGAGDSFGVKPGQKQLVPKMFINRSRAGASSSLSISPPLDGGGLKIKMKGRLPPGLPSSTTSSNFVSDVAGGDVSESSPTVVAMGKKKFERMMMKPTPPMLLKAPGPSTGGGVSESDAQEMEMHSANVSEIIGNVMNDERFYRKDDPGQKINKPRGKYKPKCSLPNIAAVPGKTLDQYQKDMMSLIMESKFGGKFSPNQETSRSPNKREQPMPEEDQVDPSNIEAVSSLVADISGGQANSAPLPKPRFLNSGGGMRRFINTPQQQRQVPPLKPLKKSSPGKPRASNPNTGAPYFSHSQVPTIKKSTAVGRRQEESSNMNLISSSSVDLVDGIKLHIRRDMDGNTTEEQFQESTLSASIPSSESGYEDEASVVSNSEAICDEAEPSLVKNSRREKSPISIKLIQKGRFEKNIEDQVHKSAAEEGEFEEDMVVSTVSEDVVDPSEVQASTETDSSNRRTSRKRKPTKHYMTDMVVPRAKRRRKENDEEVVEAKPEPEPESITERNSDPTLGVSKEKSPVDEGIVTTPRGRGRGRGTGRGRGRPRGSTLKNKLDRMSIQSAPPSAVSDESPTKVSEVSDSISPSKSDDGRDTTMDTINEVLEQTSFEEDAANATPTKSRGRGRGRGSGMTRTPRGSRGARGSRGGRGSRRSATPKKEKPPKVPLIKEPPPVQVFEEETRMSADIKPPPSPEKPVTSVPSTGNNSVSAVQDEESRASNMSSTSASASATPKVKKFTKDLLIDERKPVTAETIFEYQWPQNDINAEYFFLQEQITEFLGVKSFRRRYPDLQRRTVEMEERDFLRGQKIVTETQCDLGLTAINSSEVLDILFNDFADKYEEYRRVVQDRKSKEMAKMKVNTPSGPVSRDRSAEFMRRILKSCSKWNSGVNKDRKEERSCTFDLQTGTINYPAGKYLTLPPESTKMGHYPVTVVPGQFCDNFKQYTSTELKYLPLNTVMYGPVYENGEAVDSDESASDSDESSSSDDTTSSSSDEEGEIRNSLFDHRSGLTKEEADNIDPNETCKTCEGSAFKNKDGRPEVLIHCAKCQIPNHPTCLDLTLDMVPYIRKYDWQCNDCKNCIECNDSADEDKMLFCDCCDRGYHIYCVGLRKVPVGRWHCGSCSVCHSCGTNAPSTDDRLADWHHEFKKAEKGFKFFLFSMCVSCHKIYKKGQYCPSCLKCHLKPDDKNVLECRNCEKWVHKECITRPLQSGFGFMCDPCDALFKARTKLPSQRP